MNNKLAMVALIGGLTTQIASATDDYFIVPQLLTSKGRDKQTSFYTPGKDYWFGVYLEDKNDEQPFSYINNIHWQIADIKGGELTQAFSPNPVYLFSDYFLNQNMDPNTNIVNLTEGNRAARHDNFVTNYGLTTKGLVGIYNLRTYPNSTNLEVILTNVQAMSYTSPTSSVPVNVEVRNLNIPAISQFNVNLDIQKIDHHPWDPRYPMPNYVWIQSHTNTEGFFEILEESTDLKNWKTVNIENETINYFTSTTNHPQAYYRIRFQEFE